MSKVLVAYFSETGNTKKVAEAIGEEAAQAGHTVELAEVSAVKKEALADVDLVFIGSTCHSADVAKPVKKLLSKLPKGGSARLAGFVTHSTMMPGGTPRNTELHEQWAGKCVKTFEAAAAERNIELAGYFHCMGAANPGIEQFIHSTIVTDEAEWAEYSVEMRKHPSAEDLEAARGFARDALAKL